MAKPALAAQMKGDNEIDPERVYCTNAIIKRVGGAVAVCLEDATLPGNARNKHMTILYRGGRWRESEIAVISKETDNWIREKYGSNQAPVTFTINKWGNRSVKIEGDLNDLCLHLRSVFGAMAGDKKQRIPHCELFGNNKNTKCCHICKESGHFRKQCPRRLNKKNHKNKLCHICNESGHLKYYCPQKKVKKNGVENGQKTKQKLERMIVKMEELKNRKEKEMKLLNDQQTQLKQLLNNLDSNHLDHKALKAEIKGIAKSFKGRKKEIYGKFDKKQFYQKRRERQNVRREQRRKLKEEKRRLKQAKLEQLNMARLDALPSSKSEIGDVSMLYVYIDGYNVMGCDSLCRQKMRGRGGGMKMARLRLTKLLQRQFMNKCDGLKVDYNVAVKLWFDGNGKNEKSEDIEITFSTKAQSVDDKLVELFGKNEKNENRNVLVVTSDKALTLRLYDVGVKVMKSGVFYKTFLKENGDDINDENVDDQKEEEEYGQDANDEFVKVIADKMDEDTPSIELEDDDDSTPDEVEGDHDGENDYEFTTIFGEDSDGF